MGHAGHAGHFGRGPYVVAILPLLCVPALRSDKTFALDASADRSISRWSRGECEEEAKQTRQLLNDLGLIGPLNHDHCDISGITCDWKYCKVEKLECSTCAGHLPDHIHLDQLQEASRREGCNGCVTVGLLGALKVSLTSANLTGDIKTFQGLKMLTALKLQGTGVSGDVQALETSTSLVKLELAGTKIVGDIKAFANLALESLNLADTNVAGNLTQFRSNLQESWIHILTFYLICYLEF
eukprot:s109_g9.t1